MVIRPTRASTGCPFAAKNVANGSEIGSAKGEVVRDTRLKAFMESLERRSSERSAGGLAAEGGRN